MVYFQINMSGFLMLWHSYNPWKTFHEPLNILHHLRSTRKKAVSIHQGQKCFRRGFDKIKRPSHPCPRQWEKILRCENKTQLVEFFVDEWSKMRPGFTLEGKLISPSPTKVNVIRPLSAMLLLWKRMVLGFIRNSLKMFLCGKHAMDNGFKSIVIRSSDTNVNWSTGMHFIVSGTSSKSRIVDIAATCRNVDEDVCLVLSGLHAISGCDSVSAFSGKGTSKVFDPVSKNQNFCQTLCRVGDSFDIPIGLLLDVEIFMFCRRFTVNLWY